MYRRILVFCVCLCFIISIRNSLQKKMFLGAFHFFSSLILNVITKRTFLPEKFENIKKKRKKTKPNFQFLITTSRSEQKKYYIIA